MRTPRKLRLNASTAPIITDLTALLGSDWTTECTEEQTSCTKAGCPRVFIVVLNDGCFKAYDQECEDICTECNDAQAVCDWMDGKVDTWNRVEASFKGLQAQGTALNSALSSQASQRIKNVFKMAQEAVEMPKGFRYTAFRENKSENMVLSTLMYTSAKLDKTQWVVKSALMAQFVGEEVDGSRTGETVTEDAWAFQPNYDPDRGDAGRDEYLPKSADKLYNFVPNPNSSTDPDRQAAYWLVGILSDMLDDILNSPPNRVYEFFLADGLLKKKNLAIMEPGGLIRLLTKGVLTGPEVLKAKPSMWKKLLERGFITGEQAYKSQPNQLAWLAIHDYIPVERALKLDPSIQKQLERYGKMADATPEDLATDVDSLVQYVTDGVLTPQKAWSLNSEVLKPLVEAKLITAYDAYRLDPSILNWMLENHYIGREEATKLKPRIKQEMDRKGVDWESLDADLNSSRKLNADYADGDDEIFYVLVGKDLVLQVAKEDGKWVQFKYWQRDGVSLYLPRRYMGYLEPADIVGWIRKDYPNLRVAEISEDESYDFIEEQEHSNDLDSSRKLNSDYDYPDEDSEDLFYVAIDDDLVIRVEKHDGRWYESVEWEGEDAREFKTATYMGYLTHDDIKTWIRRDFPNAYIREMNEDEYYDFIEEQEYDDDWDEDLDSSRKLNSSMEYVDDDGGRWHYVRSKDVMDYDGFYTVYTWFKSVDGTRHIFMLTDDEPDPDYADFECESYEEARNWFEDYEGCDEEDIDSSRRQKTNAGWEDIEPEWHSSYPDWAYGDEDLVEYEDRWEYIAERWVDDAGVDRHYVLYGNDLGTRYIITYDDGEYEVEPSEDNAIEEFESYKEAKNYLNSLNSSKKLNSERAATVYFQCFDDVYTAVYKATFDDDEGWWELSCIYEDEPTEGTSTDVVNCEISSEIPNSNDVYMHLTDFYDEVEQISKSEALGYVDANGSKKLNCSGYEDMDPDTFRQAVEMLDPDSSAWDDLDELCEIVGYYPDDVGGWDEWFSTLEYDDRCTAWDFVSWVLEDEDLDSARKKFDPTNVYDLDNLRETVENAVYDFVTEDPAVNFDDEFAKEYTAVEVNTADDGRVRVEVRADISFGNLMRLADKLNKIVTKIDKESYFDAVEPGILDAYIEV